jgi:hypothetical protein
MIGRNMPVIYQRFPAKPVLDTWPLLWLMLEVGGTVLQKEMVQAIAEPFFSKITQSRAGRGMTSRWAAEPPDAIA